MVGYNELKKVWEDTQVYILTAPDGHDRLLFFNDYASRKHNPIIARQIPVKNMGWRFTEGLLSDELALRTGGIVTTAERGNLKFREFVDKGYKLTKTNYEKVISKEV